MGNLYDDDVIAWAEQQAALLRAGRWSQLDIDNIAEEIEDVGKSEKRELQSRLAVLLAHLLKWTYQSDHRGHSWRYTIREQRRIVMLDLQQCPSLKPLLNNAQWLEQTYSRAKAKAYVEADGIELPDQIPWDISQVLSPDFPAD